MRVYHPTLPPSSLCVQDSEAKVIAVESISAASAKTIRPILGSTLIHLTPYKILETNSSPTLDQLVATLFYVT